MPRVPAGHLHVWQGLQVATQTRCGMLDTRACRMASYLCAAGSATALPSSWQMRPPTCPALARCRSHAQPVRLHSVACTRLHRLASMLLHTTACLVQRVRCALAAGITCRWAQSHAANSQQEAAELAEHLPPRIASISVPSADTAELPVRASLLTAV